MTGPVLTRVLVHGLVVDSEIALPGTRSAPADGPADLTLRLTAPGAVPDQLPAGTVLARIEREDSVWHAVVRDDAGWLLRFGGAADVRLSPDLRRATATVDPSFDPGLFAVLANGFVLAAVLQLRGHLTLHASAVVADDLPGGAGALALIGASGAGKSTVATLLSRAGAPLLADDVVRVDDPGGRPIVRRGTAETRLRPAARELGDGLHARETADERLAVSPVTSDADAVPLRALLFPAPDREHLEVALTPVPPADALVRLLASPRVLGWSDGRGLAQRFGQCADLAERVPAYVVHVPWGPPFAADLGARVLAGVLAALRSHT